MPLDGCRTAPSLTVIADQDGNKGIVCVDAAAAKKD
ncbi:4a-hydroxytetrahydrobiopterin dehydratase [Asanoa ishikariensis]|uniref:4a-hydroxytetrahydrobiopterin dehydratase n=1 Tax=Asanoa ishikariensis TaxID=137265 RepID=A0A1H3TQU3_9ACTN|nr:4a-hydroxytetrahydrobiopterin dehydratase [Asanoa ishikariensis]